MFLSQIFYKEAPNLTLFTCYMSIIKLCSHKYFYNPFKVSLLFKKTLHQGLITWLNEGITLVLGRAPLGGTGVQLQWQQFYDNVSLISNCKGLSPEKNK